MSDSLSLRFPYTRIGFGAAYETADLIKEIGLNPKKVLLITDENIIKAGLTDGVRESLKKAEIAFDVFNGTRPNAPSTAIQECIKTVKNGKYDLLIGIGGGSTMDITKSVSVIVPNNFSFKDLVEGKEAQTSLPIILVPTTAGTGSEWNDGAVVTDESIGQKFWIINKAFLAKGSIIDPELSMAAPARITAETGMDVLAHAIEAYITPCANVVTDMLAETAIKLVAQNLRLAYTKGSQAREAKYNMAFAAAIAEKAQTVAGDSLTHEMDPEIVIGARIAHGAACAILLPYNMQFELPAVPERFAKIATFMGEKVEGLAQMDAAQLSVSAVKQLTKDVNLPLSLSEIGVSKDDIIKFTDNCMKYRRAAIEACSLRPVSREDVLQIFEAAL